jgi:hypothetical protein
MVSATRRFQSRDAAEHVVALPGELGGVGVTGVGLSVWQWTSPCRRLFRPAQLAVLSGRLFLAEVKP